MRIHPERRQRPHQTGFDQPYSPRGSGKAADELGEAVRGEQGRNWQIDSNRSQHQAESQHLETGAGEHRHHLGESHGPVDEGCRNPLARTLR